MALRPRPGAQDILLMLLLFILDLPDHTRTLAHTYTHTYMFSERPRDPEVILALCKGRFLSKETRLSYGQTTAHSPAPGSGCCRTMPLDSRLTPLAATLPLTSFAKGGCFSSLLGDVESNELPE